MSHIARFAAYAAAFEEAVASDDWSPLEPFFTDHVVYEVGLPIDPSFPIGLSNQTFDNCAVATAELVRASRDLVFLAAGAGNLREVMALVRLLGRRRGD